MAWRREAAAVVSEAFGKLPLVAVEVGAHGAWCHVAGAPEGFWASGRVGRVRRVARCRPQALPLAGAGLRALAVSFVGHASSAGERQAVLSEARRVLVENGALLLLDHNRPRRLAQALGALAGRPRVPGRTAAGRWRRLAYPTAREAQAAGFSVAWLRLIAGERVQLVLARRTRGSSARTDVHAGPPPGNGTP